LSLFPPEIYEKTPICLRIHGRLKAPTGAEIHRVAKVVKLYFFLCVVYFQLTFTGYLRKVAIVVQ